jgi:hypothetical protein
MAFLAETLVDEWLNRKGFFTVRGLKDGVSEIDLLGVRLGPNGLEGCHVEVQASFRPVGYITPIAKEDLPGFAKSRTSAKARDEAMLKKSVAAWVEKKFTAKKKVEARASAWPSLSWEYIFVHAVVREPLELSLIANHGIKVVPFHLVLHELRHISSSLRGGAGTDISEIVEYFAEYGTSAT